MKVAACVRVTLFLYRPLFNLPCDVKTVEEGVISLIGELNGRFHVIC